MTICMLRWVGDKGIVRSISPGENFGEKNARCALIGGDSRDPSDSRQFLADCAIWR